MQGGTEPEWKPRACSQDFEDSLVNAVQKVLNVEIWGCLFHLLQVYVSMTSLSAHPVSMCDVWITYRCDNVKQAARRKLEALKVEDKARSEIVTRVRRAYLAPSEFQLKNELEYLQLACSKIGEQGSAFWGYFEKEYVGHEG
jgi:hypothetical protein